MQVQAGNSLLALLDRHTHGFLHCVDGASREPHRSAFGNRRRVSERPRRALGDGLGECRSRKARPKTRFARAACIERELYDNRPTADGRHGRDSRCRIDAADDAGDRFLVGSPRHHSYQKQTSSSRRDHSFRRLHRIPQVDATSPRC